MKNLPIDCSALTFRTVEVVGHFDRDSGEQRTTRDGNVPIWNVRVIVQASGEAASKPEILEVRVASLTNLADVLPPFEVVTFDRLTARPWAMVNDGRGNDGVTFSADGVSTGKPPKNGSEPPAAEPVGAQS